MMRRSHVGISRMAIVIVVIVVIIVGGIGAYLAVTTTAPTVKKAPIKIAVLLVGEENDLSWNQAIFQSVTQVAQQLNASGTPVRISVATGLATSTEILPAIQTYAGQNYSIIVGGGEEDQAPTLQVEGNYPKIGFIVAGGYATGPNQAVINFRGDQGGFMMGVSAALLSQTGKVAVIGGLDVAGIGWATQGFLLGVTYANQNFGKNVSVINTFVGNFDDPAASQSAAATAVAQGADVLFCTGDGITAGVAAEAAQANVAFLYNEFNATAMAPKNTYGGIAFTWTPVFSEVIHAWLTNKTYSTQAYMATFMNHGLTMGLSPKVSSSDATIINKVYAAVDSGQIQVYTTLPNGTLVFSPTTPAYSSLSG